MDCRGRTYPDAGAVANAQIRIDGDPSIFVPDETGAAELLDAFIGTGAVILLDFHRHYLESGLTAFSPHLLQHAGGALQSRRSGRTRPWPF